MNDKESTKQRILKEALYLFAENGFEAVSVAQIANAVGIKAPSLYKHYQSKQSIYEAIIEEMNKRYSDYVSSMQMNGSEAEKDKNLFLNVTENQLVEMGKNLFLFFLHDEYTRLFRKLLTIEQFHNCALGDFYVKQYIDAPLAYQKLIFSYLCQGGILKPEDSQIIGLHFYAPIYMMLNLCDTHPEKENEALDILERHIQQFNRLYRMEKG